MEGVGQRGVGSVCRAARSPFLSLYVSTCPPARLPISLHACLSVCQPVNQPACLSANQPTCLSVCLSVSLPISLHACLSVCLPVNQSACMSVCLSASQLAYMPVCLPACLPNRPSISLLCLSHPLSKIGTQTVHEHIQTTVHTQKKNKHKHGINKTTAITTTTPTNNAKRHIAATSHFFPSLSVCPSTRREKDAADERVDPVSKLRRAAADTSKPETRSVGGSQSLGFVSYLK